MHRHETGSRGGFVLSLDFELMWGVRSSRTIEAYAANVLGVRTMVPRMLDLLVRHDLGCTWATVGLVFFDDRDAMMAALPTVRPAYGDTRLSSYSYLDEVGRDERSDPYHFGRSLVRLIAGCPRQEIATHTFSHYFCLAEGHTPAAFAADLDAAVKVAAAEGVSLRSIVFPRNQVRDDVLPLCRAAGLEVYRGTGPGVRADDNGVVRRGMRLLGSYLDTGQLGTSVQAGPHGMTDVPASLFLRPYSRRLSFAEPMKRTRILDAMRLAARHGRLFHLWFHPHNFGVDQDENFALMTAIAEEAARLRDAFGWPTLTMAQAAGQVAVNAALTGTEAA